jgi:hypothetical protein
MSNLEEILKFSPEPKQVAKFYNLFSKQLLEGETVERVEIEVNLSPKALIFTNFRIVECKATFLATDLEIKFYIFLDSLSEAILDKGIMTDDYIFKAGNSSLSYKAENYNNKTSTDTIRFITSKIEGKKDIKINSQPKNIISDDSLKTKLEKVKQLYENGLINDQEYQNKKSELLSSI